MCEGSSWTAICGVGIPLRLAVLCKHNMTHYFGFHGNYSNTSLIETNWERTLVQISVSLNYRSANENMFMEVIKWISRVSLGNTILF
jgi:hypothetical protein